MKMRQGLPEFPIALFNWNGNHGSCEMSDIAQGSSNFPWVQLWSDSCDVGFKVIGKTRNIVFSLTHFEIDRLENETKWWELTSVTEPGFKLTIWND